MNIPNHVGIILDGNGRWATNKGLNRSQGHKAGADNLVKICKYIFNKGIKIISLYVFSTENFKRSNEEVNYLLNDLAIKMFENQFLEFNKMNIKVVFSGRRKNLSKKIINLMDKLIEKTKNNTSGIINFCFNYGSHSEIVDACKKLCIDYSNNLDKIDEDLFNKYLYNDLPSLDLVIRTGKEVRLSNFMLWQAAYAELYFTDVLFPDFNEFDFDDALKSYEARNRRFGGV